MPTDFPASPSGPRTPKPPWLKVRAPGSPTYRRLKGLIGDLGLHTVCEEARCPNIGECWDRGTATVLILGNICTRACGFCGVTHGRPAVVNPAEPSHVADIVQELGLEYVVITSVNRDDLTDGGASVFAATIREIRARKPQVRIEVLIPDFRGDEAALLAALRAGPDILNHNIETVARLYPLVRPDAEYGRSLELLDRSRRHAPGIPTKSGVMVGLGEEEDEIVAALADLRAAGCAIVTLGQYLSPSPAHLPIRRFYSPDEFDALGAAALTMGFRHVEAGPLVRSSYHAREQALTF